MVTRSVATRGVRTNFRMEVELPLLVPASRARVIRNTQIAAQRLAAKQIRTPYKKTLPRTTDALWRSFKVRRPRRPRGGNYFTLLLFKFNYYLYFLPQHDDLRHRVQTQTDEILELAIVTALRLEGM